ncbi:hypothetical protein [Treponema sp.]|uniref:hypothetical protein n=1 Tax=Treponema sp. TaxID=166 RepID=UPI00298EADCA|nr:hypothetical protein [Treponema sp.]MCQ2242419.1 hypothetical protein [Treponema sp.]
MAVTFTTADRVGVVGGYIGGIASLLSMLGGGYYNGGMMQPVMANGYNCNPYGHSVVTEPELHERLEQEEKINRLTSERDMLLSDQRNEVKMLELYKYLDAKDKAQSEALASFKAEQAVINAQVGANIALNQDNIRDLRFTIGSLTKTVIPITNICPRPAVAEIQPTEPTPADGGAAA